jgi:hypothetical protein
MLSFDDLPDVVAPQLRQDDVTPTSPSSASEEVEFDPEPVRESAPLGDVGEAEHEPDEPKPAMQDDVTRSVSSTPPEPAPRSDRDPEPVSLVPEPEPTAPGPAARETASTPTSERDLAGVIWDDESPPAPRVRPAAQSSQGPGSAPRRVVVIDDDADLEAVARRSAPRGPSHEPDRDDEGVAPIGATLEDEGAPRRRWRLFRKGGEE